MPSEDTSSSARFGGSAYRSKSSSTFQKKSSSDRKNRSAGKTPPDNGTPSTVRSVASSEFTLQDATSPFVTSNSGSQMKPDLVTQLNLTDDDSSRNVSYYNDSISANSSFESNGQRMLRTPNRMTSSSIRNVSFDGSHISPASAPHQRNSVSIITPDRVGPVDLDSSSPFHSPDHLHEWMNPFAPSFKVDEDSIASRSISLASAQSDEVTVPAANPPHKGGGGLEIKVASPNLDETSVSSNMSNELEAVRANPAGTSSSGRNVERTSSSSSSSQKNRHLVPPPVESPQVSNGHGTRTLNRIVEQSTISTTTTTGFPAGSAATSKPSWMSLSRGSTGGSPESKADETTVAVKTSVTLEPNHKEPWKSQESVWNAMKPFTDVNMYQDPTELIPILSMVESKRHCWFQNEMDACRREWSYYKKLLKDNVQEVVRVEEMLQSSYDALVGYAHDIQDMLNDVYLNEEDGESSHSKEKNLLLDGSWSGEDATSAWSTPFRESFAKVKQEVDTQGPSLEECVFDVTKLKYEMMMKGKDVEEQGDAMSLRTMEQAEDNIQVAFEDLLRVADACERPNHPDDSTDTAPFINDRWLYESRYRHAAHLGLLTWEESRKEYQQIFAKVIELNDERKSRLNEILLSFLPRRKKLLKSAYVALMCGSEALEDGRISKSRENRAIEKAIEKNAVQVLNDQPSPLCLTSFVPPSASIPAKLSGRDIWSSSILKDRRLLEVKVAKDTWKSAIVLITLDDMLQILLTGDTVSLDNSIPEDQRPTLLSVTQSMTEIPEQEYLIPLSEYEVSIAPSDPTAVELVRRTRSKLFRKRDDQISLRLSTAQEAAKWVRSKLPRQQVQLSEI